MAQTSNIFLLKEVKSVKTFSSSSLLIISFYSFNFDFVEQIKFFIQLAYEILMDIIPECTNQDAILRDILTCVIRRARAQMPTCKSHTIKF